MVRNWTIGALLGLGLLSGCVTAGTHQAKLDELANVINNSASIENVTIHGYMPVMFMCLGSAFWMALVLSPGASGRKTRPSTSRMFSRRGDTAGTAIPARSPALGISTFPKPNARPSCGS